MRGLKFQSHRAFNALFSNNFFGFIFAGTYLRRACISILEISHSLGTSNPVLGRLILSFLCWINCMVVCRPWCAASILQVLEKPSLGCTYFIIGLFNHISVCKFFSLDIILSRSRIGFHSFHFWYIREFHPHDILRTTLKLWRDAVMVRTRVFRDKFIISARSFLRPKSPCLTLVMCQCVIGSVIAWARFLLPPMSHSEIKSLRRANFVLRRLFLADFALWIVISRAWTATATLGCHWSLILRSEPPLLTICLGVRV